MVFLICGGFLSHDLLLCELVRTKDIHPAVLADTFICSSFSVSRSELLCSEHHRVACNSLELVGVFNAVTQFDLLFNPGRDGVARSTRPRGSTGARHPWRKGNLQSAAVQLPPKYYISNL